jgi:TonB family protein
MKNYLLLLFLLIVPFALKAQKKLVISKDTTTYDATNIQQQATFPGGRDKFNKFVAESLKYPAEAVKNKIEGEVELSFVVNADGTLSDIKVTKNLAEVLDKEAIRIMSQSPKWIPAKKGQELVSCIVTVPISFRLK